MSVLSKSAPGMLGGTGPTPRNSRPRIGLRTSRRRDRLGRLSGACGTISIRSHRGSGGESGNATILKERRMPGIDHIHYQAIELKLKKWWEENEPKELHPFVDTAWTQRICNSIRGRAIRENWLLEEYQTRLMNVREIANELFEALHTRAYVEDATTKPKSFWFHQNFEPVRAGDSTRGFEIDKEQLGTVAAKYLRQPELQNNALDWYLLDALVFASSTPWLTT
jgi:hypothetical protein